MVCEMREDGEIYAGGELFYQDGNFLAEILWGKLTQGVRLLVDIRGKIFESSA